MRGADLYRKLERGVGVIARRAVLLTRDVELTAGQQHDADEINRVCKRSVERMLQRIAEYEAQQRIRARAVSFRPVRVSSRPRSRRARSRRQRAAASPAASRADPDPEPHSQPSVVAPARAA